MNTETEFGWQSAAFYEGDEFARCSDSLFPTRAAAFATVAAGADQLEIDRIDVVRWNRIEFERVQKRPRQSPPRKRGGL